MKRTHKYHICSCPWTTTYWNLVTYSASHFDEWQESYSPLETRCFTRGRLVKSLQSHRACTVNYCTVACRREQHQSTVVLLWGYGGFTVQYIWGCGEVNSTQYVQYTHWVQGCKGDVMGMMSLLCDITVTNVTSLSQFISCVYICTFCLLCTVLTLEKH